MLSKSILCLAMVMALGGVALAQMDDEDQSPQQQPMEQQREGQPMGQPMGQQMRQQMAERWEKMFQRHIAGCMALGNHEEVALGNFAKERASNDEVKAFADTMIKEHHEANETLMKNGLLPPMIAECIHEEHEKNADEKKESASEEEEEKSEEMKAKDGGHRGGNLLKIEVQAAKNCLGLVKKELSELKGADFDKAYMGMQIGAHIGMLAKLQAVEPYATGELKQMVQDAIEKTQKHLDEAKNICKKLKSEKSS